MDGYIILMERIDFTLHTKLSVNAAIAQISNLLASEHISFQTDLNSIRSKEIPLPFSSFNKRLYTRKNWVGINPFIFISEINIIIKEFNLQQTQIDVTICQKRAIIMYVFFISLLFYVLITAALSKNIPPTILILVLILLVIILILMRFFIFDLCIKRLIKSEIVNAIT